MTDARTPSKSFAVAIVAKLSGHVRGVKGPGAIGFCMAVISNLEEAGRWLESATDEKRILDLLDCLDGLIHTLSNWRLGYSPNSRFRQTSQPFDEKQFPGLCDMLKNKPWGSDNIIRYAKSRRESNGRAEFLKVLASFKAPAAVETRFDPPESANTVNILDSVADHDMTPIHMLFSGLSEVHCAASNMKITANLRLRADSKNSQNPASATFRIFFLDHPHELSAGSSDLYRWQDTMVSVPSKQVKFKADRNTNIEKPSQLIAPAEFCEMIKRSSSQIQIRLELTDQGLGLKELKPSSFQGQMLRSPACICLAEILDMEKPPTKKMRLLLSYFLARAFWHFYSSGWMGKSWTKEYVYFMFDPKSNMPTGVSMNEPYLSVLHPTGSKTDTNTSSSHQFRLHQFPSVLALGILLMEIELGQKIEKYDFKCYDDNGKLDINTSFLAARYLFVENPELWEQNETFDEVRNVIGTCLGIKPNGDPLDRDPFLHFHEEKHKSELRHVIYQTVVSRLHKQCMDTWWTGEPDPEAWGAPLYLLGKNTEFYQLSAHDHNPVASSRLARDAINPSNLPSSEWFKKLETNMISALRIKDNDRDTHASRVKIAILDTGLNSRFTQPVRKARRIEKYFDFINNTNTSPQDDTGHGTNIFQLMHKVCDAAEFYIGRVWEDGRMDKDKHTPRRMEKAIDYARTEWCVDIIVLSSGFDEPYEYIERAIEDANRDRILIFAAASNYGNLTGINFPGYLYGQAKVLCIFSTNPMARISSQHTFNPSPLPWARHRSFAVLGEDIILENVDDPLCGTSFSTAVGAAIAARILDFSRHPDSRTVIKGAANLKKVEGMLAIFGQMSVPDNSYRCMSPWTICDIRSIDGEERAETRRRQRAEACDRIKEALRRIHEA